MLKIEDPIEDHLNGKVYSICITNVCNLACGGCNQFCGLYEKPKLWFLSPEDLRKHLESNLPEFVQRNWTREDYPTHNRYVVIYGGEPTIHPQFSDILDVLYSFPQYPFVVFTNGRTFPELSIFDDEDRKKVWDKIAAYPLQRTGYACHAEVFANTHSHDQNVGFRVDLKTKHTKDTFMVTLVAPCDLDGTSDNPDKAAYVKKAQEHCYQWINCECAVYNNKAYACHLAAAMDHLFYNGEHGWEITEGENPFKKSKREIEQQLSNFCYRCGYNFGGEKAFNKKTGDRQFINEPTIYTPTNFVESSTIKMRPLENKCGQPSSPPSPNTQKD